MDKLLMNVPKHILLVNRKNFEWINFSLTKYLQEKFSTKFTIIASEDALENYKKILKGKNNFINYERMNSLEYTKNNKSFKRANLRKAKYYETKYNISFFK